MPSPAAPATDRRATGAFWPTRLRDFGLERGWGAFVLYLALTLATTWPLAAGITGDIPRDHGDPLLVCWILGWNAHIFWRALAGEPSALLQLWHTNMFYPERYTLAYSETLLAPALQVLPIYVLTNNVVLCYNVLFLGSYVLSGLGMYLLVREITGDWRAGIVAGAVYGFMPYRVDQGPHLQVLSSQWMPFALYGFRRWFDTGRARALAGAALALIAQNLSCGYYMVFFAPFVPAYVLWEVARRRRWRDWRMWLGMAAAAVAVAAVTIPAMWPYIALKRLHGFERSLDESVSFGGDVMGWFTASPYVNLWGPWLQTYPAGEGQLFPGGLALILAMAGASGGLVVAWRVATGRASRTGDDVVVDPRAGGIQAPAGGSPPSAGASLPSARYWLYLRGAVVAVGATIAVVHGVVLLLRLFGTPRLFWLAGHKFSLGHAGVLLAKTAGGFALTLLAHTWRRALAVWLLSPAGFFCACGVAAWWLSLGPEPHAYGHALGLPGPYRWLFEFVPGADGLRVPARFAMVAMIFIAALAGLGLRRMLPRQRLLAAGLTLAVAFIAVAESASFPQSLNERLSVPSHLLPPPKRVRTGRNPTPLSRWLMMHEERKVLAHFPFAEAAWEIHYVYESTAHFTPMLNGYSGWLSPTYEELARTLGSPLDDPTAAWQALAQSGATHAVVHRAAYRRDAGRDVEHWLLAHGARRVADLASVQVLQLPRR